jgi:hypothetical protein
MKTIKITIVIISLFLSYIHSNAQLKVQSDGKVTVRTTTNNFSSDLYISGSKVTLYGSDPKIWVANSSMAYGLGSVGTVGYIYKNINSPEKLITIVPNGGVGIGDVTAAAVGTNKLYVNGALYVNGSAGGTTSWNSSDSRFKKDIDSIDNSLSLIKKLNGRKYHFNEDFMKKTGEDNRQNYGFVAQEVIEVIPELVKQTNDSIKSFLINYQGFIPIIVEALKQQQTQIETLQKIAVAHEEEIISLKEKLKEIKSNLKSTNLGSDENIQDSNEPLLYQNTPNPFSSGTEIKCYIPSGIKNSLLLIYDLQGTQIKSYTPNPTGINTIQISGSELKAGMYIYTLITDNNIIDSKRMILLKNE